MRKVLGKLDSKRGFPFYYTYLAQFFVVKVV